MSIALFFITHEGIASNLLTIGESILQKPNNNISFHEIPMDAPVDEMIDRIKDKLSLLNSSEGFLFITDAYGSTPGNIAQQLASEYRSPLISGVNLPMIIRLLNYRNENTETLIEKAIEGACDGIQLHNPV